MMDTYAEDNWALCDKDCGWCGHCAERIVLREVYTGIRTRMNGEKSLLTVENNVTGLKADHQWFLVSHEP